MIYQSFLRSSTHTSKENRYMSTDTNSSIGNIVSVIIPCYNQGHYIKEAIDSVLTQTYQRVEIVVVDDGSTDNTKFIVDKYPSVKYIYQNNQGLSAARNTGIDNSKGGFLVFLDSDDWLLPHALEVNIKYLEKNPEAVFVSGSHKKISHNGIIHETRKPLRLIPYQQLLHQNYIGMIAAVMFRREIFDQYRYDTSLTSCEDYDLYLKITRDHKVINHAQEIAIYRFHEKNMSGNAASMLNTVLDVLKRQENNLRGKIEKTYYASGLSNWKKYYYKKHYLHLSKLLSQNKMIEHKDLKFFTSPSSAYMLYLRTRLYFKYFYSNVKMYLKNLTQIKRD